MPSSSQQDDPIEHHYRQVAAADPSRPSHAVRRAVLEHAVAQIGRPRRAHVRGTLWGSALAAALVGFVVIPRLVNRTASIDRSGTQAATAVRQLQTVPAPTAALPLSESAPAPMAALTESRERSRSSELAALAHSQSSSNANERTGQDTAKDSAQRGAVAASKVSPVIPTAPPPSLTASAPLAPMADSLARLRDNHVAALTPSLTIPNASAKVGQDALGRAAEHGDIAALKSLLDQSIDINARDSTGRSALLRATANTQNEAVEVLLAHGADANLADAQGNTPLQTALQTQHPELVAALRKAGAR